MENEILLEIICHGALLPAESQEFTLCGETRKGREPELLQEGRAGLPAPKWSAEVHAFV